MTSTITQMLQANPLGMLNNEDHDGNEIRFHEIPLPVAPHKRCGITNVAEAVDGAARLLTSRIARTWNRGNKLSYSAFLQWPNATKRRAGIQMNWVTMMRSLLFQGGSRRSI